MKRLILSRPLVAAGVAICALAAASAAQARGEVFLSIGVPVPGVYVQPAPVYVQPQPVYVQPQPVYGWGSGYYGQRYDNRRGPYGDWDRDGIANIYDRDNRHGYSRHGHRHGHRDMDRDGVPNRYDRDVDGDGVPNRHDRAPANPYRR